jgi:hypothetical protein
MRLSDRVQMPFADGGLAILRKSLAVAIGIMGTASGSAQVEPRPAASRELRKKAFLFPVDPLG